MDDKDQKTTLLNRAAEGIITTLRQLFMGNVQDQQQQSNTTANSDAETLSPPSFSQIHGQTEIKFLFRENLYAIEVFQNDVTKILIDSFGEIWTPLYLSMAEDTVKFGQEAKNHCEKFPQFVIYDIFKIIGKKLNEIETDPKWSFKLVESDGNAYFKIDTLAGPRIFPPELVLAAFIKIMKLQTQSFLGSQNEFKEIQISTAFLLTESQKVIFEKAAAKSNLSILSFVVSDI